MIIEGGYEAAAFIDDAIRVEKYYREYRNNVAIRNLDVTTVGSISVHINGNANGNGQRYENWLDFAVGWCAILDVHIDFKPSSHKQADSMIKSCLVYIYWDVLLCPQLSFKTLQ